MYHVSKKLKTQFLSKKPILRQKNKQFWSLPTQKHTFPLFGETSFAKLMTGKILLIAIWIIMFKLHVAIKMQLAEISDFVVLSNVYSSDEIKNFRKNMR